MSIDYRDFLPEVLAFCSDASEPQAINAVRNACIHVCENSLVWQVPFTLDIIAGQNQYNIATPIDSRRSVFTRVWIQNRKIECASADYLTARYMQNWMTMNGVPLHYVEMQDAGLILDQIPVETISGGMTGQIALAPTRNSTELGYEPIYEQWAEVVGFGALARLYNTMGTSFYNKEQSERYHKMFSAGVTKITNSVNRGNGRASVIVQQRPFARGRIVWR